MDLLACAECESRFYVPGVAASKGRFCPRCGGSLDLSVSGLVSIPLDAHWLEPPGRPAFEVTVVSLCRKRRRANGSEQRIAEDLGHYFPVRTDERGIQVSVNRGEAADASLRVAAVLDGVDGGWEDHFYLPEPESEALPPTAPDPPGPGRRRHLQLVRRRGPAIPGS